MMYHDNTHMVKKFYPKEGESKDAEVKRLTLRYLYFELSIEVQKKGTSKALIFQ